MKPKDEYLGCAACKTVQYRLRAVPGDHHSVFEWKREPLGVAHHDADESAEVEQQDCPLCGGPLVRMHKASWGDEPMEPASRDPKPEPEEIYEPPAPAARKPARKKPKPKRVVIPAKKPAKRKRR